MDKIDIVGIVMVSLGVLTLAGGFLFMVVLGNHPGHKIELIEKQAIEYGYAETNKLTGEWQWKEVKDVAVQK